MQSGCTRESGGRTELFGCIRIQVSGVQVILGMDAILGLGGAHVGENGARFQDSSRVCMASCQSRKHDVTLLLK